MAVLNIQSGRQKAVQVIGLKQLQQNVNAIISASAGREAVNVSAEAGRAVLNKLHSSAVSSGVPHEVLDDLFMYTRQRNNSGEQSVSVLVGLKKKGTRAPAHGYVTWNASKQVGAFVKSPRLKKKGTLKIGGQRIGENLGTMWELGTTKMAAKPWFRPGIMQVRSTVYQIMADGYRSILAKYQ
jgi:hypothetical protein